MITTTAPVVLELCLPRIMSWIMMPEFKLRNAMLSPQAHGHRR